MTSVTRDVGLNLRDPVGGVVPAAQPAKSLLEVATMPEVAVAEHRDARTDEGHIGPARKILGVDPIPEPEVPERPAQDQLA